MRIRQFVWNAPLPEMVKQVRLNLFVEHLKKLPILKLGTPFKIIIQAAHGVNRDNHFLNLTNLLSSGGG